MICNFRVTFGTSSLPLPIFIIGVSTFLENILIILSLQYFGNNRDNFFQYHYSL